MRVRFVTSRGMGGGVVNGERRGYGKVVYIIVHVSMVLTWQWRFAGGTGHPGGGGVREARALQLFDERGLKLPGSCSEAN